MRKTINFADLIAEVNAVMIHSKPGMAKEREALHAFLANILLDNECYGGFCYLDGYNKGDNTRTQFYTRKELGGRTRAVASNGRTWDNVANWRKPVPKSKALEGESVET